MSLVEIEYCVPCGLLDDAIGTQEAVLSEFGRDLDGVLLTPGHGGVFRVTVDDEVIWDKDERGGIDREAIVDAVRDRAAVDG